MALPLNPNLLNAPVYAGVTFIQIPAWFPGDALDRYMQSRSSMTPHDFLDWAYDRGYSHRLMWEGLVQKFKPNEFHPFNVNYVLVRLNNLYRSWMQAMERSGFRLSPVAERHPLIRNWYLPTLNEGFVARELNVRPIAGRVPVGGFGLAAARARGDVVVERPTRRQIADRRAAQDIRNELYARDVAQLRQQAGLAPLPAGHVIGVAPVRHVPHVGPVNLARGQDEQPYVHIRDVVSSDDRRRNNPVITGHQRSARSYLMRHAREELARAREYEQDLPESKEEDVEIHEQFPGVIQGLAIEAARIRRREDEDDEDEQDRYTKAYRMGD